MPDKPSKATKGQGLVAFFALIDDFQKLIDAKQPMRMIYDAHKERLGIGYPQFTRYVGRYIRKEKDNGHQRKGQEPEGQPITPASSTVAVSNTRGEIPAITKSEKPARRPPVFEHNPDSDDFEGII